MVIRFRSSQPPANPVIGTPSQPNLEVPTKVRGRVLAPYAMATPATTTLPEKEQRVLRPALGQRLQQLFATLTRAAFPAAVGALMLATAPAQAQVRDLNPVEVRLGVEDRFDPAKFTDYGMFKLFWDRRSTAAEGLTNQGEFELSLAGVEKLKAYALANDMMGRPEPKQEVSSAARAFVRFLLDHPHYGAFIEQNARPELQRAFGLPVDAPHVVVGQQPVKAGDIELLRGVSRHSPSELRGPLVKNLAAMFQAEYDARRDYFEDPNADVKEKSRRILGLYADYVSAIRFHGQLDTTEGALDLLTDKLTRTPFWMALGAQDFNGAGWSLVESIRLGLDPNTFKTSFPNATTSSPVTYFSMDGSLAGPMKRADDYREAMGMERRASDFEGKTVLNFMVGDESGHKKLGYFNEARPFATSGVNWGLLLFPNDSEIAKLKPKAGFEFPIDAVDAYGVAFNNNPAWGDRIMVVDANKRELRVERQIERGADGQAESWSAKFFQADGTEVPADKVLGLIVNASGRVKGDGAAAATLDMSYWGYCNVNTAQAVYKASYGIPQLDAPVVKVPVGNGRVIEVPTAEAQRILDADIESLVAMQAYEGFRFGRDPLTVRLTDGTTLVGSIESYQHEPGRRTVREGADVITVSATPDAPFPGTLGLTVNPGSTTRIDARLVVAVRELPEGKVEVEYRSYPGYDYTTKATGTLTRPLSFEGMPTEGEQRVYRPSADQPLNGELAVRLGNGEVKVIPAEQVQSITGETQSDIRPSDFVAMVTMMNGVFATDASKGPSISNGARNINTLETVVEHGAHRPAWAAGTLTGVYGPLVRQDGDRMLFRQGSSTSGYSSVAFAVWHQLDAHGQIINEGWIKGEPDFLWGSIAPLDWQRPSIWNPHLPPDFRLKLLINGVQDVSKLEALAKPLNLPANWREYRAPE